MEAVSTACRRLPTVSVTLSGRRLGFVGRGTTAGLRPGESTLGNACSGLRLSAQVSVVLSLHQFALRPAGIDMGRLGLTPALATPRLLTIVPP